MRIKERDISELRYADYNPRFLTGKREGDLRKSLERFGLVSPIIINTYKGREGIVIGGAQRLKIWSSLGHKKINCLEVELEESKERELNIRLNKNGGEFDLEVLKDNFKDEELLGWGFEEFELGFEEFVLEDEDRGNPLEVEEEEEGNNGAKISVKIGEDETIIYIGVDFGVIGTGTYEDLERVKNKIYPNRLFIELYPPLKTSSSLTSIRHLVSIKGGKFPSIEELLDRLILKDYNE